jgi:hypothetical protein
MKAARVKFTGTSLAFPCKLLCHHVYQQFSK